MLMRQHPGEMRWQLDLTEIFRLSTLWCLGELRELLRLHPEYLRSAEERGNVYSQRGLRGWRSNIVWLIRGEPAEARRQADRASPGRGKSEPFHLQHYYDVLAHSMIDLYTRDSEALWERVSGAWKEIVGSHLLRIQHVDAECHWLRGSAAVMCCKQDRSRIDIAEECVTHLRKIGSPYARVVGGQLCAAMLIRRGERDDAIEALRATIAASELAEMAAHGASARLRLGIVLGGNEGRALVEHAEQWMRDQGVADPTAFASMLSPGLAEGS
jgi:eukaryotic-like serine/threonine-protein kinase